MQKYITILDWMIDLGMDIYETITYAVIYGFTQDGESTFHGSLSYLSKRTMCSRSKTIRNLKALVERGLVEKTEIIRNGVKFCEYRAIPREEMNEEKTGGVCGTLPPSVCGTPNNKDIEIKVNYIYSIYPFRCPVSNRSTGKCSKNKKQIETLLKTKKPEELEQTIKRYLNECTKSNTYIKNFSTFLNQLPEFEEEESKYKNVEWNEIKDN